VCVCVCVCVCVVGIGYQTACLPKPQFNFSGTVYTLYNITVPSNEESS